ncbi:MAG: HAMP domain-containing protein [Nitrospinae bacterium]|nr:HAMP domain-containing protein [Nitrospinota bacterium]MBL7021509.1 HAMP domain-containing protein [Nitrospinaceae bacterium]
MIYFSKQNIRKKLLTIVMSIVMVSLLLVGGVLVYWDINVTREELVIEVTTLAEVLGDNSRAAIIFDDKKRGEQILLSLKRIPQVNFARLVDAKDRILATYFKNPTLSHDKNGFIEEGFTFEKDYLEVRKIIYLDEVLVGKILILYSLKILHEKNRNIIFVIGSVLLFTFVVAYCITLKLSKVISDPIVALSALTKKVSETDDFSLRGDHRASDEIGVLYRAFNDLLTQIQNNRIELHKTHQQLLHSEKLSATGKLAASLAHELRNPICGIRNVLEILYERGSLSESHKNHLLMAIKESDRVTNLINNLNDFNRPSTEKREQVDFQTVIYEILPMVKSRLDERKIMLNLNYAKNTPSVRFVPDQLKQVIWNLLTNAEESIAKNQENGAITIITERVGPNAVIQVQDNGVGISEEIINDIFDPFITTKTELKDLGLGLGLSIIHGIVESHGGKIVVTSGVAEGSIFKVILPADQGEEYEQ